MSLETILVCLFEGDVCSSTAMPICDKTPLPRKARPVSRCSGRTLSSPDRFYVVAISRDHKAPRRTQLCGGLCRSANFAQAPFSRSGVAATVFFEGELHHFETSVGIQGRCDPWVTRNAFSSRALPGLLRHPESADLQ